MTPILDRFLAGLDAGYWERVVDEARLGWLRQADDATRAGELAVAYACLDLAWEALMVAPTCEWIARGGR